jgi:hypothetical protein
MPDLLLHKQPVQSVFSLIGENENDITYSVGWALSQSPGLLRNLLRKALRLRNGYDPAQLVISLQELNPAAGITDIEIRCPQIHLIIEAKRGWSLPTTTQLRTYARRFDRTRGVARAFVTMSECSQAYAREHLPATLGGIPVHHVSWSDVSRLSHLARASHSEKRLMQELRNYLATIVNMQKQESNWVYVLVLSDYEWTPGLTYIQTVQDRRHYFHPYARDGWPKEPPNYLGFRFYGRLQSIHHIESAEIITNFHRHFPESPNEEEKCPYFLYKLGPPIVPAREVKTGKIFKNGRIWAMLDLLLTSKTIAAARDVSARRVREI